MRQLLRKLRGALGVALTWGSVYAVVFALVAVIFGWLNPEIVNQGETVGRVGLIGAWYGFFSGTVFAALLATLERKKSIAELSLKRVALWGAVATSIWPLLTQVHDSQALIFAPVGAGVAAGLIALARKGHRAPTEPTV